MANVKPATTPTAGKARGPSSAASPGPAGGQQQKPQLDPNVVAKLTGSILKNEAMRAVAAELRARGGTTPAPGPPDPVLSTQAQQGPVGGPLLAPGQVPGPAQADPRQLAMLQLMAAGRGGAR